MTPESNLWDSFSGIALVILLHAGVWVQREVDRALCKLRTPLPRGGKQIQAMLSSAHALDQHAMFRHILKMKSFPQRLRTRVSIRYLADYLSVFAMAPYVVPPGSILLAICFWTHRHR